MIWADGDVELSNNKESGRLCLKRSQLNRVTRTAGRFAGGRALAQFQVDWFVWFAIVAQFASAYSLVLDFLKALMDRTTVCFSVKTEKVS